MADEKKTLSGEELEKVSGGWIIDEDGKIIGDYPSTNQK